MYQREANKDKLKIYIKSDFLKDWHQRTVNNFEFF